MTDERFQFCLEQNQEKRSMQLCCVYLTAETTAQVVLHGRDMQESHEMVFRGILGSLPGPLAW